MNAFQKAVIELNLLTSGYPDEATLKAQGSFRHIRFLKGDTSGTDCDRESDADAPLQLQLEGHGHVMGANLADAVARMKARISGSAAPVVARAKKAAKS